MIKFFRKIRQKLLTENKFSKYLLYAIGEIVLVVIGILIALQINNWNEYQKERQSEQLVLREIRDNLKYDLKDFESNLITLQNKVISSKTILKALNNDTPYNDSLGFYFTYLTAFPHFSSKTNGYKLLQSKGLEIIINDALRNSITDLYEDRYQYILTIEKERINYNKVLLGEAMTPYIGIQELPLDAKPKSIIILGNTNVLLNSGYFRNINNYEQLKSDEDMQSRIKNVEIWSSTIAYIHESIKKKVLDLIIQIEQEIEK